MTNDLSNNEVLNEVIDLLQTSIFEPNLENGHFVPSIVEREKQMIIQRIESIFDDKTRYAQQRLTQIMRPNHPASILSSGTIETLQAITPESLTKAYESMIGLGRRLRARGLRPPAPGDARRCAPPAGDALHRRGHGVAARPRLRGSRALGPERRGAEPLRERVREHLGGRVHPRHGTGRPAWRDPRIQTLIERFGPARCMLGSHLPWRASHGFEPLYDAYEELFGASSLPLSRTASSAARRPRCSASTASGSGWAAAGPLETAFRRREGAGGRSFDACGNRSPRPRRRSSSPAGPTRCIVDPPGWCSITSPG